MSTATIGRFGTTSSVRKVRGAPPARRPLRAVAAPVAEVAVGAMPPVPPAPPARLRLTRRGRLVVTVALALVTVLAVVAASALVGVAARAGDTGQVRPVPVTYRVVAPGETLWDIAGEVAPRADRRDTILMLRDLNGLAGSGVRAGQRIAVPSGR